MATLANINGRSLAPDLTFGLNRLAKAFGTPASRQKEADEARFRELRLGGIEGALEAEDIVAQDTGPTGSAEIPSTRARDNAFRRLSITAPDVAREMQQSLALKDNRALAQQRQFAEGGLRDASAINRAKDLPAKRRVIEGMTRDAIQSGAPQQQVDKLLGWMNMDLPTLNSEMLRLETAGKDVKLLSGPRFEAVVGPEGNVVAQRETTTGKVLPDPRAPSTKGGLFSAVTKVLADGSAIQAGPSGTVVVRGPDGQPVEGDQRLEVLRNSQQAELDQARAGAASKAAGTQAIKKSGEAIDRLGNIKTNIQNIDAAVKAIDEGARTGAIQSRLPSIKASSIALDNIQKRMGLDVIGDTTFGALSKGELDLALSTALPTNLKPPALREWLLEKKAAQQKLSGYLESAAIFLGTPGNTPADWVREQKDLREQAAAETEGGNTRILFDAQGNPVQ